MNQKHLTPTRRAFLRWLALNVGAAAVSNFLAACDRSSRLVTSLPSKRNTLAPTQPQQEQSAQAQSQTAQASDPDPSATPDLVYPDLVVARGAEPEQLVRAVMDSLGGMRRFVSPGDDVIIKPNICVGYHSYEYAATTNPFVIGELVRLGLDAGARRVRVMDYPFGGSPDQAYQVSGIGEQVELAGGEMEVMSRFKYVNAKIPSPLDLHSVDVYDDVLKTDVLINVPIAKHHSLAKLTLGMKNLMGVIWDRPMMHANLGKRLADLTSLVKPALTIVDAVRLLHTNGPSGGSLDYVTKLDTLIASTDIVAADSYAATLFGMEPTDLSYINAGLLKGLGRADLENLRVDEIAAGG